jgi:hypothetical protein
VQSKHPIVSFAQCRTSFLSMCASSFKLVLGWLRTSNQSFNCYSRRQARWNAANLVLHGLY